MIYRPANKTIAKHIDYYWIVEDTKQLLANTANLYAYPGVTPDMIIVLNGFYEYQYLGKKVVSNKSMLFSFIHTKIELNLNSLGSFILIKFKSRALAAIQPFVNCSSLDIISNPIAFSNTAFDGTITELPSLVRDLSKKEVVAFLDYWFLSFYKKEREGFVVEMAQEVCADFKLQNIMEATNYSYSTIERYFKRETGLTPKKFESLKRFRSVLTAICETKDNDWFKYVNDYNYYDQAHFIKDIKKYTKATPTQVLNTPKFLSIRPQV
ncbi:MAG: AraC family transcriptional regulator [Gilvibacter sp.]